jgi:DNA repair protein RadC
MEAKLISHDAIRSAETPELLRLFFFDNAHALYASHKGKLRDLLSKPVASAAGRKLLAGVELGRRAAAEELIGTDCLSSPAAVRAYLSQHFLGCQAEVFVSVWLDSQHRALAVEDLFRGTLAQTSVYPREVVKKALQRNAAAAIFAHNHPSGVAEPSRADELLTQSLKQALSLVDVRVLDHFIIAGSATISFSERGLL